jgi:hypothetical protein
VIASKFIFLVWDCWPQVVPLGCLRLHCCVCVSDWISAVGHKGGCKFLLAMLFIAARGRRTINYFVLVFAVGFDRTAFDLSISNSVIGVVGVAGIVCFQEDICRCGGYVSERNIVACGLKMSISVTLSASVIVARLFLLFWLLFSLFAAGQFVVCAGDNGIACIIVAVGGGVSVWVLAETFSAAAGAHPCSQLDKLCRGGFAVSIFFSAVAACIGFLSSLAILYVAFSGRGGSFYSVFCAVFVFFARPWCRTICVLRR